MKRPVVVVSMVLASMGFALSPAVASSPPVKAALHPAGGALHDAAIVAPHPSAPKLAHVLPASVDLRPWTVPVGDQGSVGSCVTWAINYAMMGWYSRFQGIDADGTPFAPMYVYSQIQTGNDGGSYPADAYQVAATQGVDTQADYFQGNYDWIDQPTAAEKVNAATNKTTGYSVLFNTFTSEGAAADLPIEQSLAADHPVALSLPVYHAFDALTATNDSLDASQVDPSTYRGSHEVLAVGYDATGVVIQNSWGTSWGDAGFAHLNWNFVEQYVTEATTMTGLIAPTPQAPSAPTGFALTSNRLSKATITWAPPLAGGPITGYRVSRDGVDTHGTGAWSTVVTAATRSLTFNYLAPGSQYTLSVSAINAQGAGTAASGIVAMGQRLDAPQNFKIVPNRKAHSATISWTPPPSNGGATIIGYRVTRDGVDSHHYGTYTAIVPATQRSVTFLYLNWGYTYNLSVQAVTTKTTGKATFGPVRL